MKKQLFWTSTLEQFLFVSKAYHWMTLAVEIAQVKFKTLKKTRTSIRNKAFVRRWSPIEDKMKIALDLWRIRYWVGSFCNDIMD